MAKPSQHQQEPSDSKRSGGGQTIVELCGVNSSGGIAFWSRQRFDIGAELQIRIRRDALPCALSHLAPEGGGEWIMLSGFVVECPAARRPDGAHAFRVSLLLESALAPPAPRKRSRPRPLRYLRARIPGMARIGLN